MVTDHRPHGVRYSLTLHDQDGLRLLGFDNAHGIPRSIAFDHRHRFRDTRELVAYEYRGADQLLVDFFDAVERACETDSVSFEIVSEDLTEDEDQSDETGN